MANQITSQVNSTRLRLNANVWERRVRRLPGRLLARGVNIDQTLLISSAVPNSPQGRITMTTRRIRAGAMVA